jgi:hypothetical protein
MRVKTPRHVPIVLSIDEVRRLLDQLPAGSGGGRRKGVRTFFWGVELGEDAELGRPKHADEAGGLITP